MEENPIITRFRFRNSSLVFLLVLLIILVDSVQSKLTIAKECGEIICEPHSYCSQVDHSCRPCQIACDPSLGNYDKGVCEKECQDYLHDLWYMRKPENDSYTDQFYIDLYYRMQSDLRLLKILIGVVIILSTIVTLTLFGIMIYFKRLRNRLHLQHPDNTDGKKWKKKLEDYPVIYSNSRVLSLPLPDIHKGPSSHVSSNSINNNVSRGSSPDLVSSRMTLSSYQKSPGKVNKGIKEKKGGFIMENPGAKVLDRAEKYQNNSRLRKEPSESTLPEYAFDNPALVPSPLHTSNVHM